MGGTLPNTPACSSDPGAFLCTARARWRWHSVRVAARHTSSYPFSSSLRTLGHRLHSSLSSGVFDTSLIVSHQSYCPVLLKLFFILPRTRPTLMYTVALTCP